MMAKEYTVKVSGKKTKYRKIGSKYYRIKKDGELAKDPTTGLVLANLKNAANSRLVSSPDKMLATVRSAVSGTNKKGQMGRSTNTAMASTFKNDGGKAKLNLVRDINKSRVLKDGGKAALQNSKEYKNRRAAILKEKKALDIIKKDTNINTYDKTPKKMDKKKELNTLKKSELINVKVNKTKSLKNKPTEEIKKKVEKNVINKSESKLDSKGNYKGTNITPTKLQLERLKKRGLA